MKIKDHSFKKFNDVTVILSKKTNLQIIYARGFRVSIPACKDLKINTKTFG